MKSKCHACLDIKGKFSVMELLNLFNELKIHTCKVSSDLIQRVMREAKSCKIRNGKEWSQISDKLWIHLNEGFVNYDDQLLCSTCFYTTILLTNNQELYLKDVWKIINHEQTMRSDIPRVSHNMALSVSLMYGIFQSSYFTKRINENSLETLRSLLNSMFDLLLQMAYEYTKYTFIVFKTMKSFQKVCGTDLEDTIFSEKKQKMLLNMINHNWENPITGIRDLNREIMQVVLSAMNQDLIEEIFNEINDFYWSKAKFLMLTCFLKQSRILVPELLSRKSWMQGLVLSLHKPGMVSAGADMYFELLNKMRTSDDWNDLFLKDVMKVLTGASRKAIENFNNYWYLTTLKVFPIINETLLGELEILCKTDDTLYSMLFLMKQSNKLGLLDKDWTKETVRMKNIINGLDHWDSSIRMLSFEIFSVSQKKFIPTKVECDLVIKYLANNLNSDSTVLRINMLNSLSMFLAQINSYYTNPGNKNENALIVILYFCNELQQFIYKSMKINGNYQRKISTVKILKIVLNCFNNISSRKQKSKSEDALLKYLVVNGHWLLYKENITDLLVEFLKDPSDDIRDDAAHILLTFFFDEIRSELKFSRLIDNALENIRSKFFYNVDCGKTIFKLITNILIKEEQVTGIFKKLEDIFIFGLKQVLDVKNYKESVVDSIFDGKQQHSYTSIMLCVLENCNKNKHKLNINRNEIVKLLNVLDGISKQFAASDETNISTDFSQMNDMVEQLIILSKYNSSEIGMKHENASNITGLHQLVLNCLWLNVKGACDLSAQLIKYYQDDVDICKLSLNIITHVLETSRHKGAIEAAGSALGLAIQHLTSLPQESELSKMPHLLLQSKLNELILEANNMASVTRRGAGLSIMVHRIVSSDVQKEKILFHTFMKKLLEVCNSKTTQDYHNTESLEKDLPNAIYIHFLTKIVTDSSLASHTLFYSTELAEIAFQNLTDPHWQIRNAALQLYGALVPKLIGQKKASGSESESIATLACDEFRTHFPKLWTYVKEQITTERQNTLISDSNLVPILNLVANMAKRYNFSFDANDDMEISLFKSLMQLLGSPIYVVRRLTAKCIWNMYVFKEIYEELTEQEYSSENLLHGQFMLMKKYSDSHHGSKLLNNLENKYTSILLNRNHSYLCKESFEDVFKIIYSNNSLKEALKSHQSHKYEPGIFSWINSCIHNYLMKAFNWSELLEILKELLKMDDCDQHLVNIAKKVASQNDISVEILQDMACLLLSNKQKYETFGLWKTLYNISLRTDISTEHIEQCFDHFSLEQYISYKTRYILPFMSRIALKIKDANTIIIISNYIYNLLQSQTDDDVRKVAVIANNELAFHFFQFPDSIKIVILTNVIIFLQDEDEEIRNLSVNFLKNLNGQEFALNPYICLTQIFNIQLLDNLFVDPEASLKILYQKMMRIVAQNVPEKDDDCNPFSSDTKNIYMEVQVLKEFVKNINK